MKSCSLTIKKNARYYLLVVSWILQVSIANAQSYSVQEISRVETDKAIVTLFAGNQYLNDQGKVIGTIRFKNRDGISYSSNQAFVWQNGKFAYPGTFGKDALGYGVSSPSMINHKGHVAGNSLVYKEGIDQGKQAFFWNRGGMDMLKTEPLGFVSSSADALSDNGFLAGKGRLYEDGKDMGLRPILWKDGRARNLGIISTDPHGYNEVYGIAVNDRGVVSGNSYQFVDYFGLLFPLDQAFIWRDGVLSPLGDFGPDTDGFRTSVANAMNNAGQVVGFSSHPVEYSFHAVLWENGAIKDLGGLGVDPACSCSQSYAFGINEAGDVIGYGYVPGKGYHSFLWSQGTMTDLGALGKNQYGFEEGFPNGINEARKIVGYSTYSEGDLAKGYRAFLYQDGAMVDLNTLLTNPDGLILENAIAINNKGQITAYGTRTVGTDSYPVFVLLSPDS